MRTVITLVCHNRPHYLREVLQSLRACNPHDMELLVVQDNATRAVRDVIAEVDWIPKRVLSTQLGINYANRFAYETALEADCVFAIEDDTTLAPDCLELVRWFAKDRSHVQLMNCFACTPKATPQSADVRIVNWFSPWGWCFKPDGYREHVAPIWMTRNGWDISINEHLVAYKVPVFEPVVSRMWNIGREGGVHFTPELYDANLPHLTHSDGSHRNYILI